MKTVKIPHFSTTEALVGEDFDTEDLLVDETDLDVVEEVIEDMKSLAVGINQEMTRQMDTYVLSCNFKENMNLVLHLIFGGVDLHGKEIVRSTFRDMVTSIALK